MKYLCIFIILLISSVFAAEYYTGTDYYTVQLLKTKNYQEADAMTKKYKELGFDAFTQTRIANKEEVYLSCINKFPTDQAALIFGRNLQNLKYFQTFKVAPVLSKYEWIQRIKSAKIKKEKAKEPIRLEQKQDLNPNKLAKRDPASEENIVFKPKSFEGKALHEPIENPIIKGQKFVSTDKGLFVSFPTSSGDHWMHVNAPFEAKNVALYFKKDGSLCIDKYILDPAQKAFTQVLDPKTHKLVGYKVSEFYEKEGLLWVVWEKSNNSERKLASESSDEKRILITADGKDWSELPSIIKKDF